MRRIIKLNEAQLKAAMGKSFDYLNEDEFTTPFENGSDEEDEQLNPTTSGNCQQVRVSPVIQNDTHGTEVGRPATGDEFAKTQSLHTPLRNAYSPSMGGR